MDEQPNKKRASERQITKDDLEEDEEQASDTGGTWQRASDDVLSKRRIVKARRPTTTGAGAVARAPNPFASTSFASAAGAPNPFAAVAPGGFARPSAVPSGNAFGQASLPPSGLTVRAPQAKVITEEKPTSPASQHAVLKDEPAGKEATEGEVCIQPTKQTATPKSSEPQPEGELPGAAGEPPPTRGQAPNEAEVTAAAGAEVATEAHDQEEAGTKGVAAGLEPSQEGTVQNLAQPAAEGGVAVDGAVTSRAGSSFLQFASAAANAFSAATSKSQAGASRGEGEVKPFTASFGAATSSGAADSFPSLDSVYGQNNGQPNQLFTSSANNSTAAIASGLSDGPVVTGEEEEEAVFRTDASLFEFVDGKWHTRTRKGDLRLNVNDDGQARLVMRATGTSKLLLNANLWPEMTCAKMEERGVTFACVNHVGEEPSSQLSTYAVRMKEAAKANEFLTAVGNFKSGGTAGSVEKGLSRKRSTEGGIEDAEGGGEDIEKGIQSEPNGKSVEKDEEPDHDNTEPKA
mmetsp:Transcript_13337/g.48551  ORF Transcript_13337/g.48551 Transcript_13337/m.48551 type:complete len:518 (-) Transcript_13337:202-1755(-)|eukprot:scaffold1388_cov390-Prasinococcus_capsulatus_cf.AAC.19